MKFNILNRKVHYWATAFMAIPLLVIVCTGILLQVKKQASWIQPTEQRGTGTTPNLEFEQILTTLRQVPEMGVSGWDDIDRLDVRPGKGIIKVLLHTGWELQLDLGTGQVLQVAYRRSDLIESLHDGSFFAGDWTKLGLFLPTGIVLLFMWMTGIWLFWLPFSVKRKRRLRAQNLN